MWQNKLKKIFLPNQFLFRLTFLNMFIIIILVGVSSFAIYNTACMLADRLITANELKQSQFKATLLQYIWIFMTAAVLFGGISHFYLTKKLIYPLRELIESTKQMKKGHYPQQIIVNQDGEIGELTYHFNDLIQQIKENEKQRKKLINDLSHELRTPLANLNGYLQALEQGVIEGNEQLYKALHEQAKQLVQLVEQMEALKEWDYQQSESLLEKEMINIKEIVNQSVDMFAVKLQQKRIGLLVQVDEQILRVNEGAITQVINNLLDNAIRYYEGNGDILVTGKRLAGLYELSVRSEGKEIPINEQAQVFERFYRVDQSRSRQLGGSGLGLAICKEIIAKHHGTMSLYSTGTVHTFSFKLPID